MPATPDDAASQLPPGGKGDRITARRPERLTKDRDRTLGTEVSRQLGQIARSVAYLELTFSGGQRATAPASSSRRISSSPTTTTSSMRTTAQSRRSPPTSTGRRASPGRRSSSRGSFLQPPETPSTIGPSSGWSTRSPTACPSRWARTGRSPRTIRSSSSSIRSAGSRSSRSTRCRCSTSMRTSSSTWPIPRRGRPARRCSTRGCTASACTTPRPKWRSARRDGDGLAQRGDSHRAGHGGAAPRGHPVQRRRGGIHHPDQEQLAQREPRRNLRSSAPSRWPICGACRRSPIPCRWP